MVPAKFDVETRRGSAGITAPERAASPDLDMKFARMIYEAAANNFLIALMNYHRLVAKAGFDPAQPRVPAGSSGGGQWTDAGGGAAGSARAGAESIGPKPARRRNPLLVPTGGAEEEENPRRSIIDEFLDPLRDMREGTYGYAIRNIRRLEPGNPETTYMAPQQWAPSSADVNRASEELENARTRVAHRIAGGHALKDHAAEFPLGATQEQLAAIVRSTISDPKSQVYDVQSGRTVYYSSETNTFVIVNPRAPDSGSVYRPRERQAYVDGFIEIEIERMKK